MKVLVTGGAGLIGLAARRLLPGYGHDVIAADITDFGRTDPSLRIVSLSDHAGLDRLIADEGIEAIVHGGGVSGPVMARDEPLRVVEVNITATAHLLDIARRRKVKCFVLLSSHVVYGDVGPGLISEAFPLHPGTSYAASKVAGEALVESYAREFGLSGTSLRLTRVYGPYRRDNCFLRQAILDHRAGVSTPIPCDPEFRYHYLYVDDVVGAIAATLAAARLAHHAYNVTSGEPLTMPQVASTMRAGLPGADVRLVPGVDDAPDVQMDFDLRLIRQDLGWSPAWPLAQGFAAYLAATPEPTAIA